MPTLLQFFSGALAQFLVPGRASLFNDDDTTIHYYLYLLSVRIPFTLDGGVRTSDSEPEESDPEESEYDPEEYNPDKSDAKVSQPEESNLEESEPEEFEIQALIRAEQERFEK